MLAFIVIGLIVLVGSALGDYLYVRWMQACVARNKTHAVGWSMTCAFVANGMVTLVVPDPWMLMPLCVGNGVGTWFALHGSAKPHHTGPEPTTPSTTQTIGLSTIDSLYKGWKYE